MTAPEPYTRESLLERLTAGWEPEYLFFWGHTAKAPGPLGQECLSQWYPASFTVDGTEFATAEHFMMWQKARLFEDAQTAERILAAEHPEAAKKLGRGVRGFDEARWNSHRFAFVVQGNVEKFGQNPSLKAYLLRTNAKVLVEASPRDAVWGIGLAASHADARAPAAWPGLNLLGFALMKARASLAP